MAQEHLWRTGRSILSAATFRKDTIFLLFCQVPLLSGSVQSWLIFCANSGKSELYEEHRRQNTQPSCYGCSNSFWGRFSA